MLSILSYVNESVIPNHSTRYILTGGPGTGKTEIIKYLSKQFETIREAATDIILQEQSDGFMKPWLQLDFDEKIALLQKRRQLEIESKKAQNVFCDRSPFDVLTYCLYHKTEPTQQIKAVVQETLSSGFYSHIVFLIEDLGTIVQDHIRPESLEESRQIEQHIDKNYKALGFTVVRIPALSVAERAKMILDHLSLKTD